MKNATIFLALALLAIMCLYACESESDQIEEGEEFLEKEAIGNLMNSDIQIYKHFNNYRIENLEEIIEHTNSYDKQTEGYLTTSVSKYGKLDFTSIIIDEGELDKNLYTAYIPIVEKEKVSGLLTVLKNPDASMSFRIQDANAIMENSKETYSLEEIGNYFPTISRLLLQKFKVEGKINIQLSTWVLENSKKLVEPSSINKAARKVDWTAYHINRWGAIYNTSFGFTNIITEQEIGEGWLNSATHPSSPFIAVSEIESDGQNSNSQKSYMNCDDKDHIHNIYTRRVFSPIEKLNPECLSSTDITFFILNELEICRDEDSGRELGIVTCDISIHHTLLSSQRKEKEENINDSSIVIVDGLHLIGGEDGPAYKMFGKVQKVSISPIFFRKANCPLELDIVYKDYPCSI